MATKLYFVKADGSSTEWLPTLTQQYAVSEERRVIRFLSADGFFELNSDTHALEHIPHLYDPVTTTVKVNKHTFWLDPPAQESREKIWSQLPVPHLIENVTRYKYLVHPTLNLKVVTDVPNDAKQPLIYFECAEWNDSTKKALHSFLSAMKV